MKHNKIKQDTYTIIEILDDEFTIEDAEMLKILLEEMLQKEGSNVIVSLKNIQNISLAACQKLEQLHHLYYDNGHSIVFSEPIPVVHNKLKQEQLHIFINICPTKQEAIEIINMEMLERDLMNE